MQLLKKCSIFVLTLWLQEIKLDCVKNTVYKNYNRSLR